MMLVTQDTVSCDLHHWQRCLEDFLVMERGRTGSEATYRTYEQQLRHFFSMFPGKHPSHFTKQDVLAFIHSPSRGRRNLGQTVSTSAVNQRLTVVRSFYTFCLDYDIAGPDGRPQRLFQGSNPARGIQYGQPARRIRYLTESEIKALFAVIPTDTLRGVRDRAAFLLYFYTARRRSEVGLLTWSSIEPATFTNADGIHRQGHMYKWYGKGKSGVEDSAELPEPAWQAIIHWLEFSGRLATMQPDSPLFVGIDPGGKLQKRAFSPWAMNDRLKSYARAAGIEKDVSLHIFRHSAARMRRALGADIHSIMRTLRHARLDTTSRYLELLASPADGDAAKLGERFSDL